MRADTRQLSYGELWTRANRVANMLRSGYRLETDHRFAVMAMNTIEFPELFFGAALSGCACIPINYRLAPREIAELLADSEGRLLIADRRLEETVQTVLDIGFEGPVLWLGPEYDAQIQSAAAAYETGRRPDASAVVIQIYTSGTTGVPKGAMLSHRSLLANAWTALAQQNVVADDVYLLVSPLCHLAAGARVFSCALAGAELDIRSRFDAEQVVQLIDDGTVTTTVVVPAMLQSMLAASPRRPSSATAFRRLTYGSAPISLALLEAAVDRFRCEFQQGYGLTEASPNLTSLLPSDHRLPMTDATRARLASVGRESIGVAVRVVSPQEAEVQTGETGEVVARGANIMEGYWKRAEATDRALRGGWLHTGDIGRLDEAGYLYLVDRVNDMLISGGINVYPREIEVQLEAHPAVADVAVVGRADDTWGEVPVAFVVLRAGVDPAPSSDSLRAYCLSRLAKYKVPAGFRFMDELPRNAGGKVQKRVLRDLAQEG